MRFGILGVFVGAATIRNSAGSASRVRHGVAAVPEGAMDRQTKALQYHHKQREQACAR